MTASRSPAAALDGADDAPIIAAGGVVLDGEGQDLRVLVVHRPSYDDWSFPKGHVDAGETVAEAALREVREETGLEARIVQEAGTTEHTVPVGTRSRAKRVHWFLMRAVATSAPATPAPDPEVDHRGWWTIDVALERLSYANEQDLLRRIAA